MDGRVNAKAVPQGCHCDQNFSCAGHRHHTFSQKKKPEVSPATAKSVTLNYRLQISEGGQKNRYYFHGFKTESQVRNLHQLEQISLQLPRVIKSGFT
jgi:hypothetical protein